MKTTERFLSLMLAALALFAGGCASPAPKTGPQTAAQAVQQAYNYVPAEQFAAMEFPPPPVPGSAAQKADLAAVMDWQAKRTLEDCARAESVFFVNYETFWGDGLFFGGKAPFRADASEEVKEFFKRVDSDAGAAVDLMKERFKRPRPFAEYPVVEPCIKKSRSPSYPSGHAAFARIFACVLGDLVPERSGEFMKKADEIAHDRVVGGVHYPSDIAAGKAFGAGFHARLLKSPAYLRDIERLKAARQ